MTITRKGYTAAGQRTGAGSACVLRFSRHEQVVRGEEHHERLVHNPLGRLLLDGDKVYRRLGVIRRWLSGNYIEFQNYIRRVEGSVARGL